MRRRMMMAQNSEPMDYSQMYLTFRFLQTGTIKATCNSSTSGILEYSINQNEWQSINPGNDKTISVSSGDRIRWRASGITPRSSAPLGIVNFTSTYSFVAYGNIMSLQEGDNFVGVSALANNYQFANMFNGSTGLISAENLILPATTLKTNCYRVMFSGCTKLIIPPQLPAEALATQCYYSMFNGCTSLTTAPKLPATTLAQGCYYSMFEKCSSLLTAPDLLAATLLQDSYRRIFADCKKLNYIKCLATSIGASYSHTGWTSNVASSGTFVKASAMTSWPSGSNGIPSGWSIQNV